MLTTEQTAFEWVLWTWGKDPERNRQIDERPGQSISPDCVSLSLDSKKVGTPLSISLTK